MLFSTPIFLFLFLPLTLAAFFLVPRAGRTALLVAASLVFYAWGEKQIVFLLAVSIVLNWALALAMEQTRDERLRRALLVGAVVLNIGALVYFKYTNFLVANLNVVLGWLHHRPVQVAPVHLPIGVSFVTFEALSYVVDVYRGDARAARNPLHTAFYVTFFPHLIAGPILRFRDIAAAVRRPIVTAEGFDAGVSRFVVGLSKKMLIANPLGSVADQVFKLAAAQLTPATAWLGVVCYTLQIYYDFSGYSDMAIGLGRLFGFSLPENFRLPYAADSIKEFWRRWHITLSTWYRDYLFIPLGGSRATPLATYRNLIIVFFLCGLWHGASWTFVVWGLFHGAFLVLERLPPGRLIARAPAPLRHAYTMLAVMIGWVFFRADSLPHAWSFLSAMACATHGDGPRTAEYLTIHVRLALVIGVLGATAPWLTWSERLLDRHAAARRAWGLGAAALQLGLLFASLLFVAAGTYNPFIYFRF